MTNTVTRGWISCTVSVTYFVVIVGQEKRTKSQRKDWQCFAKEDWSGHCSFAGTRGRY